MWFTNMRDSREEVGLRVYDIEISVWGLLNIPVEMSNRYLHVDESGVTGIDQSCR